LLIISVIKLIFSKKQKLFVSDSEPWGEKIRAIVGKAYIALNITYPILTLSQSQNLFFEFY
jgi:hypothetical protein